MDAVESIKFILESINSMTEIMDNQFSHKAFGGRIHLDSYYRDLKDFATIGDFGDPTAVARLEIVFFTLLHRHSDLRKVYNVAGYLPFINRCNNRVRDFDQLIIGRALSPEEVKERQSVEKNLRIVQAAYDKALSDCEGDKRVTH